MALGPKAHALNSDGKSIEHVENGKFVMLAGCLPGKTTLDQLINIFINYMDRNPEQLDNMLMLNISDALEEIFPCKNK